MENGLRLTEGIVIAATTLLVSGIVGYYSGRLGVERELARQAETAVSLRRDLDRLGGDVAPLSAGLSALARDLDRISGQMKDAIEARDGTDEQVAALVQADQTLSSRLTKVTAALDDMAARLSLVNDQARAMSPAQQECLDLMGKVKNPPGAMVLWRSDGTSSLDDASQAYLNQFQELGCAALLAGHRP